MIRRYYYTAVFCAFYGTAGLALCLAALCGCGSGPRTLPGDRGPSLLARGSGPSAIPPLPEPVTFTPDPVLPTPPPAGPPAPPCLVVPEPVAVVQPVGPPVPLSARLVLSPLAGDGD